MGVAPDFVFDWVTVKEEKVKMREIEMENFRKSQEKAKELLRAKLSKGLSWKLNEEQEREKARVAELEKRKKQMEEIKRKKEEARNVNSVMRKERLASVERSRSEVREKVRGKVKTVVELEEFKALKKNNVPKEEPKETDEERFLRELAEIDKAKALANEERRKEEERLKAEEDKQKSLDA